MQFLAIAFGHNMITAPKTRRLSHSCATIESADRAAAPSAVRVTRDVDRSYTEWCVHYNTELLLNTGNSVLCSMCNGRCNRDITDWRNQRIVSHGLVFTSFIGFEVTAALFRYCCDIRVHYNCSVSSSIARTTMIYTVTQYILPRNISWYRVRSNKSYLCLQCNNALKVEAKSSDSAAVCLDIVSVTLDVSKHWEMIGNEAFQIRWKVLYQIGQTLSR